VKVDSRGKLVPWLAERWYTTDSKNYTFFLRKGVRFHNGREMKAADVKFVLDRAVNPETKHPYRTQYEAIREVIVKDDYTISVTLKNPDATFLWTVARQGSVIYPREAVDTLKTQPLGTGPFQVAEWVRGDRIVLTRNKDYWQKGLPHLDKVTYRFISDPNAILASLKSGDLDVSSFGIGPESVDELKKDGRFQVILGDSTNDVTLSLNNTKKPYSDTRVRLAITHAINKDELLKGAMFGYGRILGSNVDPLNPYFVDVSKRVPYDPAKAKKLLAEAGYPNGFDAVLCAAPRCSRASSARSGSAPRSSRSNGASGSPRSGRTPTTTCRSSGTPRPGTSATSLTRSTTSDGTTPTSRSCSRSRRSRWTTRSGGRST
jgi:peptide/nickel transport system substrate-binding protein